MDITTTPIDRSLTPGSDASVEIQVKRNNEPIANAEVAVVVVDESVLSLS